MNCFGINSKFIQSGYYSCGKCGNAGTRQQFSTHCPRCGGLYRTIMIRIPDKYSSAYNEPEPNIEIRAYKSVKGVPRELIVAHYVSFHEKLLFRG